MNKKIDIKKILTYLFMFLILLYPFNATIISIIYPNNTVCLFSVLVGMIGLFLVRKKYRITKQNMMILFITIMIAILTLINNHYWLEGRELTVILFTIYLFIPFIISSCENLEIPFCKVMKVFLYEHIIGTYFGIMFNNIYTAHVLPKICSGKAICTAIGNNYHGYMTGFTTHFSTNAIYLSISSLYFFSEILKKKNKKSIFLFILSLIALFTTGKRAHLIFTLLCCLIVYIAQKSKSIIKKYSKIIVVSLFAILLFVLLSKFIPEITNIIVRFETLIDKGNVLNGRSRLYDLAFNMWENHVLFGNGWGSFSYFYQTTLYSIGSMSYLDAHNVFLQLLCETGIIGFSIFTILILCMFVKSLRRLKKNEKSILNNFIFAYQLFFILYCFTGNPLYDPMCYVIYFITIGFVLSNKLKEGNAL